VSKWSAFCGEGGHGGVKKRSEGVVKGVLGENGIEGRRIRKDLVLVYLVDGLRFRGGGGTVGEEERREWCSSGGGTLSRSLRDEEREGGCVSGLGTRSFNRDFARGGQRGQS